MVTMTADENENSGETDCCESGDGMLVMVMRVKSSRLS